MIRTLSRRSIRLLALGAVSALLLFAACGKKSERTTSPLPPGTGGSGDGGLGGSIGGQGGDPEPGTGGTPGNITDPVTGPECDGIECAQGINAACYVYEGMPFCQCKAGFSGPNCEDTAECPATPSAPSPCVDEAECIEAHGSFRCECDPGYSGDGEHLGDGCEGDDECSEGTHGCLAGSCSDTETGYDCECPDGKFGDGVFCKDTDHCAADPCQNGGACENTPDGFVCSCPLGYSGSDCSDSTSCADISFADGNVEAAVRSMTGISSGAISAADLAGYKTLSLMGQGVTSLVGLECWTSLEDLTISYTGVSDLSPLADLGSLRVLDAACTSLTNISSLGSLSTLEELYLDRGPSCFNADKLSSLSGFEKLTGLRTLFIGGHELSSIGALSSLGRLITLEASSNEISSLSALGPLSSLHTLIMSANSLTDVDGLNDLPSLRVAALSQNEISDLSGLEGANRLTDLDLTANLVSDTSALAGLLGLRELQISFNSVSDLSDIAALTSLLELNVANTSVQTLKPLVDNKEFGTAGTLRIGGNLLDCATEQARMDKLAARGMEVIGTCK